MNVQRNWLKSPRSVGAQIGLLARSGVAACFASALVFGTAVAQEARVIRVDRPLNVQFPEIYKADEFIVELTADSRRQIQVGNNAGQPQVNIAALQKDLDGSGAENFQRLFPGTKPQPPGGKYPDLTGYYKVKIGRGVDLTAAMQRFANNPHVDHVEAIGIHPVHIDPNDPYYKDSPNPSFPYDQWHYFDRGSEDNSIQADLAWEAEAGSANVAVGILDTGVRYLHADLGGSNPPGPGDNSSNGNIWVNPGEIPGNGIDDDGNGRVDDVVGYDFLSAAQNDIFCTCSDADCGTQDNDPRDYNGHGTHVSGTVSAITNNNRLVAGVAGGFSAGATTDPGNGVKVIPLRIGWQSRCFGADGYGFVSMDAAAQAMTYLADLVDAGVNVAAINCSWGSSNSGGIDAAVNNLLAHDVMIIHAAGNGNSSSADYLGNKAGVLNVAATDRNGVGASFTNYGSWVDVAAPGVAIMSTWHQFDDPAPDYIALLDGTSMAAPHVVGIAALLESCNTALSRTDKFSLIVGNTRPYVNDGRNLGSGIANAKLALDAAGCTGQPGCSTNAECEDADPCTTDVCSAGSCLNTPINCNDGDACTSDSCSGGACFNDPIACSDGNLCTTDSCDSGSGCIFTPLDCNDGDLCTNDSCNGATGSCSYSAVNCTDGNACTADSCNPATGCQHLPLSCGPADGCCPSGCSGDPDCPTCGAKGEPCTTGADCCSNKCTGPNGRKTCK